MSVRSRLSGKEYPNMDAFVSDLQAGVNEDIETAVAPLRQQIANLQRQISSLESSGGTTGDVSGGSGGTTATSYTIRAGWTGGIGLPDIPITINVNGESFTTNVGSSGIFSEQLSRQVPAGARVTLSTPYRGIWAEGQINPVVVAFDATSYTFTAGRNTTFTVSLQPQ
jgi:hypothetical protein